MLERGRLLDFLSKILVFDPDIRLDPKEALQHPFITSVTRNMSPAEPVVQPINNETQSLSPALIYASLSNTSVNNSSSINTSRTTEDSLDIRTPPNLQQYMNRSKENLLLSPTKSPKIIVLPSPYSKTILSPQTKHLKSILKKKPSADYQKFIQPQPTQQDNTLDTRVAFLYNEPRPHSAVPSTNVTAPLYEQQYTSYTTTAPFNNQFSNTIAVSTPNTQNYQQQQSMVYNNNTGYHVGQPPYITAQSPMLYQTQQQYNIPQQAPITVYPNRHFSPLQQY